MSNKDRTHLSISGFGTRGTRQVLCMETALTIRRVCLVEGKSISEVARRFQLSRTTVRKYLKGGEPPSYQLSKLRAWPRLGAYQATV